jgi:hypothetical protein
MHAYRLVCGVVDRLVSGSQVSAAPYCAFVSSLNSFNAHKHRRSVLSVTDVQLKAYAHWRNIVRPHGRSIAALPACTSLTVLVQSCSMPMDRELRGACDAYNTAVTTFT